MPVSESIGSHSEEILHFGGVRLRVIGAGSLNMKFSSLDDVITQDLLPLPMIATNAREPLRLANFISQRALLTVSVSGIDQYFRINKVVLFTKPIWSEYPG